MVTGNYLNTCELLESIADELHDFFIYLGDVVYSESRGSISSDEDEEDMLEEYRQLYKDSRGISALYRLLGMSSIYAIWDDHEFESDWEGSTINPSVYSVGNQSFSEYMPIRQSSLGLEIEDECAGSPQFKVFHWGSDIDLIMLDTRSCRSESTAKICEYHDTPTLPDLVRNTLHSFSQEKPSKECIDAINSTNRTMLGNTQKSLFEEALFNSSAKFRFVISSVPFQQLYYHPYDGWEGYQGERAEILKFIRNNDIENVIFLTTDRHLSLMNEVFIDRFEDSSPIAYEIITGPIAMKTSEKILRSENGAIYEDVEHLFDLLDVDCRHLDKYPYVYVEVNARRKVADIILKDEDGRVIQDQFDPSKSCEKVFK